MHKWAVLQHSGGSRRRCGSNWSEGELQQGACGGLNEVRNQADKGDNADQAAMQQQQVGESITRYAEAKG